MKAEQRLFIPVLLLPVSPSSLSLCILPALVRSRNKISRNMKIERINEGGQNLLQRRCCLRHCRCDYRSRDASSNFHCDDHDRPYEAYHYPRLPPRRCVPPGTVLVLPPTSRSSSLRLPLRYPPGTTLDPPRPWRMIDKEKATTILWWYCQRSYLPTADGRLHVRGSPW